MTTASTVDTAVLSRPDAARNAWVPLAQWLALVTMTVEHACRFLLPADAAVTPWAITAGRVAFPLFAGMVAWHACHNTRDPLRYAGRILLIALAAQLPYLAVQSVDRLNVCFTLAAGLLTVAAIQRLEDVWYRYSAALVAVVVWLLVGDHFEYAHLGLLLVPAFWAAFHYRGHPLPQLAVLALGALINAGALNATVSLATVAALLILSQRPTLPSLPRLSAPPRALWLAWYPGHFALLALWIGLYTLARPAL
ncbi:TraX family protein [Modicisalibacter tunisiensis]|uniref:TraX protein n=1 Tax=Modicisalibacter tunisiensis TaxID=390637 RepID=A0ABS7WZB0_9GAMM|nr:TraX family protein [Modicisalibacter tunisiensis]MBZ9567675.1 hypothetical protein [Modicisalibacter tunisiensis]